MSCLTANGISDARTKERIEEKIDSRINISLPHEIICSNISATLFVVDSFVFILNIILFELAILIKAAY